MEEVIIQEATPDVDPGLQIIDEVIIEDLVLVRIDSIGARTRTISRFEAEMTTGQAVRPRQEGSEVMIAIVEAETEAQIATMEDVEAGQDRLTIEVELTGIEVPDLET